MDYKKRLSHALNVFIQHIHFIERSTGGSYRTKPERTFSVHPFLRGSLL